MDQLIHGEVPYRLLQLSGRLKLHFMLTINGSHAQKSSSWCTICFTFRYTGGVALALLEGFGKTFSKTSSYRGTEIWILITWLQCSRSAASPPRQSPPPPQRVSQCCWKSLGFLTVAFSLLPASGLAGRLAQGGDREAQAHVHPGRSSTASWCGWVEIDGCGGGRRR